MSKSPKIPQFDIQKYMRRDEIFRSTQNLSIKEICKRFDKKYLKVPDYQREETSWDDYRRNQLIDSILRNHQIPFLIWVNRDGDDDSVYYILDGLQRITTIRKFKNNEFSIIIPGKDGEKDKEIFYKNIPENAKRTTNAIKHVLNKRSRQQFRDYTMSIDIYKKIGLAEESFLFSRLQNSIPLNPSQRINYLAFDCPPGIVSTCWRIISVANNLLRSRPNIDEILIRKSQQKYERTEFNSMVGSIFLNHYLSSEHENLLETIISTKNIMKYLHSSNRPVMKFWEGDKNPQKDVENGISKMVQVLEDNKIRVKQDDFVKIYNEHIILEKNITSCLEIVQTLTRYLNENKGTKKFFVEKVKEIVKAEELKDWIKKFKRENNVKSYVDKMFKNLGLSLTNLEEKNIEEFKNKILAYVQGDDLSIVDDEY